jgi:hypothetical protein
MVEIHGTSEQMALFAICVSGGKTKGYEVS